MPTPKAALQREVDIKDYTRCLLIWMGKNPKKQSGLTFEELGDAVGLALSRPKAGPLKIAIENVLITKVSKDNYRLPKRDIVRHLIVDFNNEEKRKEAVFGRPPLLIGYQS